MIRLRPPVAIHPPNAFTTISRSELSHWTPAFHTMEKSLIRALPILSAIGSDLADARSLTSGRRNAGTHIRRGQKLSAPTLSYSPHLTSLSKPTRILPTMADLDDIAVVR